MKQGYEMEKLTESLRAQSVSENLLKDVEAFRTKYPLDGSLTYRVAHSAYIYFGREVWEMAISALLTGNNILLSGPKATGKNVLADNLSLLFGRPVYNMSFNVNTDSASLIGADTFIDNEVKLRRGPVYLCAVNGGFGVFDEVNMAKNDAVSVLHSALDYRRMIDIPGYEKIELNEATRFIGTMNYGYAGTKELNEALVSRFLVIDMPPLDEPTLMKILENALPGMKTAAMEQFAGLFLDLQTKALNGEISTKPIDLRGMIAAAGAIRTGLAPASALRMGMIYKSFDVFEREITEDVLLTRIPQDWTASDVF